MSLKCFGIHGCLIICVTAIALISTTTTIFKPDASFAQTPEFTTASARGFFDLDSGEEIQPPTGIFPNISEILDIENSGCPGEIAIYVHGVWADEEEAWEQGERVFLSLQDSGYHIPVVGYSWDSNTAVSLSNPDVSEQGWRIAKEIANGNGQLLAQVILDYKEVCPNDDVRLLAHSLGARVTLAALQSLNTNPEWNSNLDNEIKSVHLVGAAVDNEQVSTRSTDCPSNIPPLPCSGQAIDAQVGEFFNLYDPEDNLLQFVYDDVERDNALGWCGEEGGAGTSWWLCFEADNICEPEKYNEYSVRMELPAYADSDADNECDDTLCLIFVRGDNHFGYLGYRGFTIPIINDGAMDKVGADRREQG
jgi:hypothetical protein